MIEETTSAIASVVILMSRPERNSVAESAVARRPLDEPGGQRFPRLEFDPNPQFPISDPRWPYDL